DPREALAEPDQVRVASCARREPLRRDMQRLEQVRLADAIRADGEHEPWAKPELEPRVRPEAPELQRCDDQAAAGFRPGRRIGMPRYVKSACSPGRTAGRSGLISLKRTSSPSIDSRPSRRKSALKPISSVSPV